jgi:hypothetical protein
MKKLILVLVLTTAACAQQGPMAMTAQQDLDFQKAIAGRTPGPPQSCVQQRLLQGNKTYGQSVIVFGDTADSMIYLNRPPAGCPELRGHAALRTRTTTDQLCRNDIVTVFDPTTGIEFGGCGLGDFVPYRRS